MLCSTMFQARGRSISTGAWDMCGTSVNTGMVDECVLHDLTLFHTWNFHTWLIFWSVYSHVAAPTWVSVQNKALTGYLVMNRLQYIMNAFDLVVICWAVPVIKVNLPKPNSPQWHNRLANITVVIVQVNDRGVTWMPCAGDWRALIKHWVSHGARSPISTCLLCSLGGTGSTLQDRSLLMCLVLSRKLGRSPERSKWTFLDIRNRRTLTE